MNYSGTPGAAGDMVQEARPVAVHSSQRRDRRADNSSQSWRIYESSLLGERAAGRSDQQELESGPWARKLRVADAKLLVPKPTVWAPTPSTASQGRRRRCTDRLRNDMKWDAVTLRNARRAQSCSAQNLISNDSIEKGTSQNDR